MALGHLVNVHPANQDAAAAAGAVPLMLQLAKSSDAALQREAVMTLGSLVSSHAANQSAAGAAGAVELMSTLLSTSPHPEVALKAVDTLNDLVSLASNASTAVSLGAVTQLTKLKGCKGAKFDGYIVRVLEKLAQAPQPAKAAATPPAAASQPSVKIATGSEVERQVSGGCTPYTCTRRSSTNPHSSISPY
jgi:hypothetical protein